MNTGAAIAVMVKARTKYGTMLTAQNYREMMACASVNDIAAYLKTKTVYAEVLRDVKESVVHRGNLEAYLKKFAFAEVTQLCKFDSTVGDHFFEYVVLSGEIKELLTFLRFYNAGNPADYALTLPEFFNFHTKIALDQLPQVKNFDDFMNTLKGSALRRLISPFRPIEGNQIDYSMLESTLRKYLYTTASEYIRRTQGETAAQLEELFGTRADLDNLRLLWREKKWFDPSPQIIQLQLIPLGHKLSRKKLIALTESHSEDEILRFMAASPYHISAQKEQGSLDIQCQRILQRVCRKLMVFSTHPEVVLAAFSLLLELEIDDITTVIEGVRYQNPPDVIAQFIIQDLS